MSHSNGFLLHSPSKINLFLEVLGKRPDGFHELETVMVRTNLCDTMHFAPCDNGKIELRLAEDTSEAVRAAFPLDESNLILKSANALKRIADIGGGAVITINKRIPMEAGLAGGSGNAATTLMGLNRLWKAGLSKEQLHEIAATLGSDINFFVEDCRAAVCTGRGETVRPIDMTGQLHFVAARPNSGNSTPEVFRNLSRGSDTRSADAVEAALCNGHLDQLSSRIFNRLTTSAMKLNPEMAEVLSNLGSSCGKTAFMSGSGSTCFACFNGAREAKRLAAQFAAANPDLNFVSSLSSA